MRTTIYLGSAAATEVERIQQAWRERYGVHITISALFSRLLGGETVEEIIERPFRPDLNRLKGEIQVLDDKLKQTMKTGRLQDLHQIHREVADLFPRTKTISNTVAGPRKDTPDFRFAQEVEAEIQRLMTACGQAILRMARMA